MIAYKLEKYQQLIVPPVRTGTHPTELDIRNLTDYIRDRGGVVTYYELDPMQYQVAQYLVNDRRLYTGTKAWVRGYALTANKLTAWLKWSPERRA